MTSLHALKNSKEHNLETYINRELSLLEFHKRVLAQAKDTEYPLLERLNFLTIFSRNLDEFFEIRVASLIQQMHIAANATGPEGMPLSDVLQKISRIVHEAVEEQYKILNFTILPQLQGHGVHYIQHTDILEKHKVWIKDYFFNEVQPVVTPISLDPAHPFPRLVNKSLNFIVTLEGKDAFGREIDLAIVPAPRSLPRLLRLPRHISGSSEHYILLSAIIQEHISDLFPGMKATGCYQFRVTRNADLTVSEDVDDLAIALKGELSSRRFGRAVRLEVDKSCPKGIADYLLEQFELEKDHLYFVDGPVNLACFISNFDLPELRFPSYQQKIPKVLYTKKPIFDVLKAGDVLLHHPFDSFAPVIKLLRDAAYDPSVLAI